MQPASSHNILKLKCFVYRIPPHSVTVLLLLLCQIVKFFVTPCTKLSLAITQVTSELFDMLSDNSEVDHPLCEECTDTLLQSMEQQLELAEQVTTNYCARDYMIYFYYV